MKKYEVKSKVQLGGSLGTTILTDFIEFDDNENVFGKVLIYRSRMSKYCPNKDYELISVKEV